MKNLSRRKFLRTSTIAVAAAWAPGCKTAPGPRRLSANEKLNIGVIGTANRARSDIAGVQDENIVAVCDIDNSFLASAREKFPQARSYNDFRKLLEQKDIDAVVIATADHTHAVATAAALRLGKHVYCEKPLTHTVFEARAISRLAAKHHSQATQLGTQIHAGSNYRRVVELVQSGAIGSVSEVHVWCEKSLGTAERPTAMPPIPPGVNWDLWLGPAQARPYHPDYLPKTWRHWWDFGEGILGDMACHYIDLPFWALHLSHPLSIETEGPAVHPETTPPWLIVRYAFPSRGKLGPVNLTWYDGGKKPALVQEEKVPDWRNGVLFVGSKGMLIADYSRRQLLPEDHFVGFEPPAPFIPDSIGHHKEWIRACKTGAPTSCSFAYGAALTEAVLLGNVAYRTGVKLEWDASRLKATNTRQADNFIRSEYRKGWEL